MVNEWDFDTLLEEGYKNTINEKNRVKKIVAEKNSVYQQNTNDKLSSGDYSDSENPIGDIVIALFIGAIPAGVILIIYYLLTPLGIFISVITFFILLFTKPLAAIGLVLIILALFFIFFLILLIMELIVEYILYLIGVALVILLLWFLIDRESFYYGLAIVGYLAYVVLLTAIVISTLKLGYL